MLLDATPRDLGDGLTLRWSTAADIHQIGDLASRVFRDGETDPPEEDEAAYVQDLMSGRHPLMTPRDFAVVEDRRSGRVVACSCLLRQTWQYGGVPFSVGRPEQVATDPAYRRRGLIRAIFGALHARSAARGDLVQAITGIPYFYRQFGYEYAIDLHGARHLQLADVPATKAGAAESYALRAAWESDVPFLAELYDRACSRSLVSAVIPLDYWRHKVTAPPASGADWKVLVITDAGGAAAGYVQARRFRTGPRLVIHQVALAPGAGMRAVAFPILRALRDAAPSWPTLKPLDPPTSLEFRLGRDHPWYEAVGEALTPRRHPPYAWYVRVADLPSFLQHIAPVLETRLAHSVMAGYTGELRLEFYQAGLRAVFRQGKLTLAEDWQQPEWSDRLYAAFPPLVFLQLLFGYRSLDELRAAYPDVWCHEDVEPLVKALFPKSFSCVLPLD